MEDHNKSALKGSAQALSTKGVLSQDNDPDSAPEILSDDSLIAKVSTEQTLSPEKSADGSDTRDSWKNEILPENYEGFRRMNDQFNARKLKLQGFPGLEKTEKLVAYTFSKKGDIFLLPKSFFDKTDDFNLCICHMATQIPGLKVQVVEDNPFLGADDSAQWKGFLIELGLFKDRLEITKPRSTKNELSLGRMCFRAEVIYSLIDDNNPLHLFDIERPFVDTDKTHRSSRLLFETIKNINQLHVSNILRLLHKYIRSVGIKNNLCDNWKKKLAKPTDQMWAKYAITVSVSTKKGKKEKRIKPKKPEQYRGIPGVYQDWVRKYCTQPWIDFDILSKEFKKSKEIKSLKYYDNKLLEIFKRQERISSKGRSFANTIIKVAIGNRDMDDSNKKTYIDGVMSDLLSGQNNDVINSLRSSAAPNHLWKKFEEVISNEKSKEAFENLPQILYKKTGTPPLGGD